MVGLGGRAGREDWVGGPEGKFYRLGKNLIARELPSVIDKDRTYMQDQDCRSRKIYISVLEPTHHHHHDRTPFPLQVRH